MFHASKNALMRDELYILTADRARARLFRGLTPIKELEELESWEHKIGRRKDSEIYTDRPGGNEETGAGHHTYARETGHDPENDRFAKELAQYLEKARQKGEFKNLVLVAAPEFLGALRQKLSKECKETLYSTIDKDLVHQDKRSIVKHLSL